MENETVRQQILTGERAGFMSRNAKFIDCIFENGESPLKESRDIELEGSMFKWKYPLWYCKNVLARNTTWFEMGRSGVWYTENITIRDSVIEAPKNFRRCDGVTLENVTLPNAQETLWSCRNVRLRNVNARGDYFGMNSADIEVDGLILDGNYCFDGGKNIVVRNSKLLSKDSFWNTENVTVYDSYIFGEYLGWNSKNLTLVNCTVESLQGFCYIDNLVMKNCKLINTTLAFEYSTVDAQINSKIDSVFNPVSGTIQAETIDELILQSDRIDPGKTKIILKEGSYDF